MKDEWTTFNVKYFAVPMTALVFGLVIGFGLDSTNKPSKKYPIEVCLIVGQAYQFMDVDSVVGNMAYRDGIKIKLDNVACIKFK
jgi:hypothetical protein